MIPWLIIFVGGIMIVAGIKDTNPVALIKETLGG